MQSHPTRSKSQETIPKRGDHWPVQLNLPGIEFAPVKVREHGYVEAHTWPLVSRGKVRGVVQASFRVHASVAWDYPGIELRSATAWPVVCLDCDGTDGYSRLMVAVDDREIPLPNWVVQRNTSGGCHGVWCLEHPVHRGVPARAKPLRLLTRATEYMAQKVEADPGYGQVLSHNPMVPVASQDLKTDWLRRRPYRLIELAEIVPFGWRRPSVPATGIGRNCSLFEAGMKWAGSPKNLKLPVFVALMAVNEDVARVHGKPSLEPSEVAGIARSVERYRQRWIEQDLFYSEAERSAWGRERGIRSGVSRRKGTPLEHDREPWKEAGLSRRTWYRKQRWKQGFLDSSNLEFLEQSRNGAELHSPFKRNPAGFGSIGRLPWPSWMSLSLRTSDNSVRENPARSREDRRKTGHSPRIRFDKYPLESYYFLVLKSGDEVNDVYC